MSKSALTWCVATWGCDPAGPHWAAATPHSTQSSQQRIPTLFPLDQTQPGGFKVLTLRFLCVCALERSSVFFQLFLSSLSPQMSLCKAWAGLQWEKKECGVQYRRSSQHSFPLNFLLPPSFFLLKVVVCTTSALKITLLWSHTSAELFPLKLYGRNDDLCLSEITMLCGLRCIIKTTAVLIFILGTQNFLAFLLFLLLHTFIFNLLEASSESQSEYFIDPWGDCLNCNTFQVRKKRKYKATETKEGK